MTAQSKRFTVHAACALDILELQKEGFFLQPLGHSWTRIWNRDGKRVAAVRLCVESQDCRTALRIQYDARSPSGVTESLDYLVDLVYTDCTFGGDRPWFVCPLSRHKRCVGRARILYLPPGETRFGCRICHRLTYASCKLSRNSLYREIMHPLRVLDQFDMSLAGAQDETSFYRELQRAVDARRNLDDAVRRLKEIADA